MNSSATVTGKVDLNVFVDQAAKLAKSLDAGTSLLYNNSGKSARFYCYNGGDFVMAVPYSKPTIANGCSGLIAAGGTVFKVFADNKGEAEFLVKPNKAYVYGGTGDVREL